MKGYFKMKNGAAIVCLTGAMMFGAYACGNKEVPEDEAGTQAVSETGVESSDAAETGVQSTSPSILDAQRVSEREDYVGLQDLDIDQYVTLNDYKNMKVTAYKPAVDDESIEAYINSNYLTGSITDRAVENGDVVNIDYEGKEDGVAFEGGTASGEELEIGSGSYIAGFEEGLIGVMPGETTELDLTFPENYAPEHAGKSVVFTVKVNSIAYSVEYANATDEDLKRLGLPYNSKEELWEAAKAEVEKIAEDTFEANKISAILNQCLSESIINEIPEYLVDEEIQNYEIYMESLCQKRYYGMHLEDYLSQSQGITIADLEADIRPDCEKTVQQYLLVEALARAEKIEVTDELIREHAEEDIAGYEGYTVDSYLEEVGHTTYRMFVLQELLVDRLVEIIAVEPVSE